MLLYMLLYSESIGANNEYLLLTEFEGHTVSREWDFPLQFIALGPWIEMDRTRWCNCRTDRENEVSTIFKLLYLLEIELS